jgi:flagellar biosynthesis/type III secretory pathway chaperone
MSPALLTADPVPMAAPMFAPAVLEALYDALVTERRLLDDLVAQMRRQRSAVGADDIDSVDESVFATHRILATLGQARQRRRQLNELLGGTADMTLRDLEARLGPLADDRLREARVRLQGAADTLSREVGMNRKLLREALAQNSSQVRALSGQPEHPATYVADGAEHGASASRGLVVNRTA